jgi:hypothetical protein
MFWNHRPPSSGRRERSHRDVDAYNAAFEDLGLEWRLDADEYERLRDIEGEENRIRAYLQAHHAHLLKVYDLDFLCGLIADARRRQSFAEPAFHSGAA